MSVMNKSHLKFPRLSGGFHTGIEPLSYLFLVLIGALDYLSGPEISMTLFYLLPILLVTWNKGRRRGMIISLFSAAAWFFSDFLAGLQYSQSVIYYWNVGVVFGFFVISSYLLSSLKRSLETEERLARTDFLTGVSNKRSFFELANLEIGLARRQSAPISVVYLDLDNFKAINDAYGHLVGDTLLFSVANTMVSNLRETDVVARFGGDEFAVLLPRSTSEQTRVVIDKMRLKLLEAMQRHHWNVTFSIGAVTYVEPPASVDEMIRRADALMYEVKTSGKNTVKMEIHGL